MQTPALMRPMVPMLLAALLAGCGGSGGVPDGAVVDTPAFQSYTNDHNGHNRVRLDYSTPADAAVIAQIEANDPTTPADYKDVVARLEEKMAIPDLVTVDVIAQLASGADGAKVTRVLRLTADTAPFENVVNGRLVTATGTYYFKGQSFAWVTIDGGPVLSGYHSRGLDQLAINFDTGTADITIRTEVTATSEVEITLVGTSMPFNVVTGAYGGDVAIAVRNPSVDETYDVAGSLRGNVGGSPTYTSGQHGMATSGLFTAEGVDGATVVVVNGIYYGIDPNALP